MHNLLDSVFNNINHSTVETVAQRLSPSMCRHFLLAEDNGVQTQPIADSLASITWNEKEIQTKGKV